MTVSAQTCTVAEARFGTSVLAPIDNSVLALSDSSVLAPIDNSVLALSDTAVLGRCDILALAHSCNFGEGRCDTPGEELLSTLDWEHFGTAVEEPSSISPLAPGGTAVVAHFGIVALALIYSSAWGRTYNSASAPIYSAASRRSNTSALEQNGSFALARSSTAV